MVANPLEDLAYGGGSGPGYRKLQVVVALALWWLGRARTRALVSSPMGSSLLQVIVCQAMAHFEKGVMPLVKGVQPFLFQAD